MTTISSRYHFDDYPPKLQAHLVAYNAGVAGYYWAALGLMFFIVSGCHWFHRIRGWASRAKAGQRVGHRRLPAVKEPNDEGQQFERQVSWRFAGRALHALYRKWTIRHSGIAEAVYLGNLAQIALISYYLACNFLFMFLGSNGDIDWIAHHAGKLTYANLPLVIGLASKNNLISKATGFAYESLNVLHRWSARFVIISSSIHIGGRLYVNYPKTTPSRQAHTVYIGWGWVAFGLFIIMISSASRKIRNAGYQTFLTIHLLSWYFIVTALLIHRPQQKGWIWGAMALHMVDRIGRGVRVLIYHYLFKVELDGDASRVGSVKAVGPDTVLVSVRTRQDWISAQHVYLHCPTLSPGGHPFTVSNISRPLNQMDDKRPRESVQELLIRVRGGLTKQLFEVATGTTGAKDDVELGSPSSSASTVMTEAVPIKAWTEGPYGREHYIGEDYNTVLLVAGGSGISFALSTALNLVRRARAMHLGSQAKGIAITTTRLSLVWCVKNASEVEWIGGHIREMCTHAPPGFLHIAIYITARPKTGTDAPVLPNFVTFDHRAPPPSHFSGGSSRARSPRFDRTPHLSTVEVHSGRPDFNQIIEQEVETSEYHDWLAVGSCGPQAMNKSVAAAVSAAIKPSRVLRGELRRYMYLTIEEFGW